VSVLFLVAIRKRKILPIFRKIGTALSFSCGGLLALSDAPRDVSKVRRKKRSQSPPENFRRLVSLLLSIACENVYKAANR
jgi:hypothetical protein